MSTFCPMPPTTSLVPRMPPPRKTALLIIFLTVFIDLLGFGMVLPLLPIYGKQLAEQHGFSRSRSA